MADKKEIKVPDIGGTSGVDVIEILVKKGDTIQVDTPLITLESDKASMEIPSPEAGVVHSVQVKLGDKLSEGDVILTLLVDEVKSTKLKPNPELESNPDVQTEPKETSQLNPQVPSDDVISEEKPSLDQTNIMVLAGPSVRRLARELGVSLASITGTGRKSRVSKDDLMAYVKHQINEKTSTAGLNVSEAPSIDFSQFGPIDLQPLTKIKRLTGIHVHRAWVTIPHVTQFDEADITELERFRKEEAPSAASAGFKLTILAFVCKVVSKALMVYPQFNASLDVSGEHLIYKRYYNVGIAVETPNGLVVPVIKGVDSLSIGDIAKEMARVSAKARDKGLTPVDMSGGCFTVSSLGGIGGTAFTPIVNSPEVAILGLSRASMKPIYIEDEFKPRLMLPLSLSYDHRVIDGAEAARFTRFIADGLSDIRRILL